MGAFVLQIESLGDINFFLCVMCGHVRILTRRKAYLLGHRVHLVKPLPPPSTFNNRVCLCGALVTLHDRYMFVMRDVSTVNIYIDSAGLGSGSDW